jgi:hypothetical protein
MNETNKTNDRSPWPACADCQAEDAERCSAANAASPVAALDPTVDAEDGWEQLEVSRDLGEDGA